MVRARIKTSEQLASEAPRSFPDLTVQVLTRGRLPFSADFGCGRFSAVATPGAFIVTPPDEPCDVTAHASFETVALSLPSPLVQDLIGSSYGAETLDFEPLYAGLGRSPGVAAAVQGLWSEIGAVSGLAGRLMIEGRLLAVLGGLVRAASCPRSGPEPIRGGLTLRQLARACEAMDARLDADLGLSELATAVGLSPTHFSRAFKQSTGVPPSVWLLHRRVDRAKSLLISSETMIVEIALAVGFSAQAQFTTAFKRVTGLTPGVWRRTHKS